MKRKRQIFGGTLFELLILLSIQAILFASFTFQNSSKEKILTKKIIRFISSARNISYQSNSQIYIERNSRGLSIYKSGKILYSLSLKKINASLSPKKIIFYSTGSNSPSRITIPGSRRCRVSISLRGRISAQCGR